jgi:quinoprotein glucose dehydrogenase
MMRCFSSSLRVGWCLGLGVVCALHLGAKASGREEANPSGSNQHKTWQQYGGGADQSHYMDLKQITRENVNQLQITWNYADPAGGRGNFFNPIVVDGVMYVVAKGGAIVALDAATGKEIWSSPVFQGIIRTGINYWESKDKQDRRLIFCANQMLQALDAKTGLSITNFGNNGVTSLKEGLGRDPALIGRAQNTAPGAIYDDLILVGSSPGEGYFSGPGHVRAYSVITGKLVWVFHTIPFPGEYGYETWPRDAYKYAGGNNTWGEITVDEKNGIAYFPLGAPTFDFYGADRVGDDLYDESVLALDVRTGKRIWFFQTIHHGLWDYDLCSAPELITIEHDGKTIPAVAVAGKVGFLYVFNRLTGEPIWPIVEREVPPSDVPQEWASRTQPFPTAPPPFTRHNVTTNDINPYYPREKREEWVKRIAAARTGLFQPLSDKYEVISMPGAVGGANRGCTAGDPEHGIVYVTANEMPSVWKLIKGPPLPVQSSSSNLSGTNIAAMLAPPVNPNMSAKEIREQSCNVCHVTLRTSMPTVPDLTNVARISLTEFETTVSVGKGLMPAFPTLEETTLRELYALLGGTATNIAGERGDVPWEHGASQGGGFAGGHGGRSRGGMRAYPEGVVAPTNTYKVGLGGYGMETRDWLSPPWSTITAYDLNKGTIKWHVALGQDPRIVPVDGKMTGLPDGEQRRSMIVTSTGIVFATCADGKLYAYDADDGSVIWSTQLPRNTEGLQSMYEVNGRAYIAICLVPGTVAGHPGTLPPGYVVYGLPEKN